MPTCRDNRRRRLRRREREQRRLAAKDALAVRGLLRDWLLRPLTPEEAEAAYASAPAIPLTPEEIRRAVEYATRGGGP